MHTDIEILKAWETFNVIVGSSAAALTGLQFVAITLMAETARRNFVTGVGAFATPTIVHFGAVLLVSALLTAPWPTATGLAPVLGIVGLVGVVYVVLIVRRIRNQPHYQPVLEDWIFHVVAPLVAYGGLTAAALRMSGRPIASLFGVAAVQLVLLIVGIHNAWDTVSFTAISHLTHRAAELERQTRSAPDEPPPAT
jgi:hypothetical protein